MPHAEPGALRYEYESFIRTTPEALWDAITSGRPCCANAKLAQPRSAAHPSQKRLDFLRAVERGHRLGYPPDDVLSFPVCNDPIQMTRRMAERRLSRWTGRLTSNPIRASRRCVAYSRFRAKRGGFAEVIEMKLDNASDRLRQQSIIGG